MENYRSVASKMKEIEDLLAQVQIQLKDTYLSAKSVKNDVDDAKVWSGEAQLVASAFLDLILKYHMDLVSKDGGPVEKATTALVEFRGNNDTFYSEWEQYGIVAAME